MPTPVCSLTPTKKWFPTSVAAKAAAARIEWDHGAKLAVYKCPGCPYYHLTTKEN